MSVAENTNYQKDYDSCLTELFFRIKSLRQKINHTVLKDELTQCTHDSSYLNYYLNYVDYDDYKLSAIYSDKHSQSLKHNDDFINRIVNHCNFIVLEQHTLLPIVTFFNKSPTNSDTVKSLKEILPGEWSNIEFTKFHLNGKHICLFNYNDQWYICHSRTIEKIDSTGQGQTNTAKILLDFLNEKNISLDMVNKQNVYHILLKHSSFKKFATHLNCLNSLTKLNESGMSLLWVCDKMCNLISCTGTDEIGNNIQYEKRNYFSCVDELLTSLEIMNNDDVSSKNIQYGGYFIKILSDDKKTYKCCFLKTDVYKYISSLLPKHTNQYKNYLELYQYDKLTEILPYLHKYPADVIRRINMSVKILSKEILNIYHLTRKKQNCELYESLPPVYKKILYDLHKIYVNQKLGEFIVKSNDILKEKKSISVDIVYNYLKNTKNADLIKLFEERRVLMHDLNKIKFNCSEIMSVNNIDIITQTELMFS